MDINSLFDMLDEEKAEEKSLEFAPLARRMRPQTLDEIVGQEGAIGEGSWLRTAIKADALSSIILYGPAGTGKTTIANVIAKMTSAHFDEVSAVSGTVADLRKVIAEADARLKSSGIKTILFIDEIHRFSRSQQDCLLHAVENRTVILIGATTENPYFEVNTALISRSRVVLLDSLTQDDICKVIDNALQSERGLYNQFTITKDAKAEIVRICGGDARSALNSLELASQMAKSHNRAEINEQDVHDASPTRALAYDKNKDMHYDIISAFIKSMRGSDPDAALYWMARMLEGGEDPKFIARRIFICASEDVGNADPRAVLIAEAAFRATEVIGMPECQINLSQAATYVALAPKSNAAEASIQRAMSEVKHGPERAVPNYLRDRHRPGSKDYGDYLYPHDFGGWVRQQYLPDGIENGDIYKPGKVGWEADRTRALEDLRNDN